MKKSLIFIFGIVFGILVSIFGYSYFQGNKYITLGLDYSLPNGGILKKGTKLKYNSAFSEGFTQYVMYLNIPSWTKNDFTIENENNMIIPYWIEPIKEKDISKIPCDSIFEFGEKMPTFKGGDLELMNYNMENIFPLINESINQTGNLISKLKYTLVISTEGKVLDAEINTQVEKILKDKLEKELLTMPNWIAGQVYGKNECIKIKIPISCIKWE